MTAESSVDYLRARLEVAAHHVERTGDAKPLERLSERVSGDPSAADSVNLTLVWALERERSRHRDPSESTEAWSKLHRLAADQLGPEHELALTIRDEVAAYIALSDGDPDRAVMLCETDLNQRRAALGPDHRGTHVAVVSLADALRVRDHEGDLARALDLLREEVGYRRAVYGQHHDFTWQARESLARALVRLAECTADRPAGRVTAAEAVELAANLVDHRGWAYGRTSIETLEAHLVHVSALLIDGQIDSARTELRYVGSVLPANFPALDQMRYEELVALAA